MCLLCGGIRACAAETRAREMIAAADARVREATDRLAVVERDRGVAIAARAYAEQHAQHATAAPRPPSRPRPGPPPRSPP